ncbi:uncharacterized protein LOC126767543, partial [Bactrocera neohumeralis]|uniref:uncharacterized protein LOC126767543 n=1 Tax=Bactrocera neohumeralis TaxID=98809 RepID=UPI0021662336
MEISSTTQPPRSCATALSTSASLRATAVVVTFLPGAAQGATAVLLGHPLDTAKTRMQTSGPNAQHSALVTIARMARHEGPRSLFRGCTPPLLMEGMKRSLQFALWDTFRDQHARAAAPSSSSSSSRD